MDEMRSDNTFYTYYSGDRGPYNSTEKLALFLDDETVGWSPDRYNGVYSSIARVNTILGRLDASELTEEEKDDDDKMREALLASESVYMLFVPESVLLFRFGTTLGRCSSYVAGSDYRSGSFCS